jgi:NifU-like protein involved in Fe-S cluster formation
VAKALYTPEILALAVSLGDWPLSEDLARQAELRSQSCGSVVRVGLEPDSAGKIARFGVDARACALGQASAAVLASHVIGRDRAELVVVRDALTAFFGGASMAMPDWPGIEHLETALPYPARHGSILLPWRAVVAALDSPAATDTHQMENR